MHRNRKIVRTAQLSKQPISLQIKAKNNVIFLFNFNSKIKTLKLKQP